MSARSANKVTVMETTPRLSVTVLNYNYGHYLGECLRSILAQSMTDFEIILINDCSTDNSREIIAPFLSDPRIRLVDHDTNQGYVFSLLEGCRLSRGHILTVISADDYALDSHAFARACQTLEADPAISLCYSAWHEVNDQGEIRHTRRAADHDYVLAGPDEFRRLLLSSPILHSGAMIPRWAYDAVGGYDPECRYSVDTNMWLALCAAGKIVYIDTPLYAYRAHNSNLSQSAGSLWRATEEMLFGIENAFARFPSGAIPDAPALRHRARQRALVAVPTLDIFAGRLWRGWQGYGMALRRYPLPTLMQARTLTLLLRTLLGARAYRFLADRLRPKAGNSKHRTLQTYA